jgi:hypothetical protein
MAAWNHPGDFMKAILVCVIVVVFNATVSLLHMMYTADRIASVTGYVVSLGILPLAISVLVGCVSVTIIGQGLVSGLKSYWWIPILGVVAAISSVGYVIWRMSQPGS